MIFARASPRRGCTISFARRPRRLADDNFATRSHLFRGLALYGPARGISQPAMCLPELVAQDQRRQVDWGGLYLSRISARCVRTATAQLVWHAEPSMISHVRFRPSRRRCAMRSVTKGTARAPQSKNLFCSAGKRSSSPMLRLIAQCAPDSRRRRPWLGFVVHQRPKGVEITIASLGAGVMTVLNPFSGALASRASPFCVAVRRCITPSR